MKVEQKQAYRCWICEEAHDSVAEAKKCEARGLVVPSFKIGDTVMYAGEDGVGEDVDGGYHERKVGTVLDLLFPEPEGLLRHDYAVSYLVRMIRRGCPKAHEKFFEEGKIEFLRTARTVEVVHEGGFINPDRRFCATSKLLRIGKGKTPIRLSHPRTTVVFRWESYVANVVRRNPQLEDRLQRLTPHIRGRGSLD